MAVASVLHGVDISAEDVIWLQEHGVEGLFVHDCERLVSLCTGVTYDVIVAGEIIEHLSNPGMFLKSVASLLSTNGVLLLTTVNANPIKRMPRLIWGNEVVHPDHTCYYSYSTLTTLLARFGWSIEQFNVYWRDVGLGSKVANRMLKHLPFMRWYADGFALLCRTTPPK
jgi:2-polyprenyl-3-methyl-5-hydroxy-6-metoxy-1,4-benzoquinol methylase